MKKILSLYTCFFLSYASAGDLISVICTPINGYANTPLHGNLKPGLGVEYFIHQINFDLDNNVAIYISKSFPLRSSASEFRFVWGDSLWVFNRNSGAYAVNQVYYGGTLGAPLESGMCEKIQMQRAF